MGRSGHESAQVPASAHERCLARISTITSQIQPVGVLVAIDTETQKFVLVSENVGELFGHSAQQMLKMSLLDLEGEFAEFVHFAQFRVGVCQNKKAQAKGPLDDEQLGSLAHLAFDAGLKDVKHCAWGSWSYPIQGNRLVFELMPSALVGSNDREQAYYDAVEELRNAAGMNALAELAVRQVREFVPADRVVYYRFLEDQHGFVVAESLARRDVKSFLGLHFPESDLPAPVRDLYLKSRLRFVTDRDARAVPLRFREEEKPPQLPLSVVRGVMPMHLAYLRNMGVRATISLPVIVEQKLVGLVLCHFSKPFVPDIRLLQMCRHYGDVLSQRLSIATLSLRRDAVMENSERLRSPTVTLGSAIEYLSANGDRLLQALGATGLFGVVDGESFHHGLVPNLEVEQRMIAWLRKLDFADVWSCDSLADHLPDLSLAETKAAGLLVVGLPLGAKRDFLVWMRPEAKREVRWAGRIEWDSTDSERMKNVEITELRRFNEWREKLDGYSVPWGVTDRSFALGFRERFLELRFVHLLAEISSHEGRSESTAVILHDLGNALNGVVGRSYQLRLEVAKLEQPRLGKLRSFFAKHQDELELALGSGSFDAVCRFMDDASSFTDSVLSKVRELLSQLDESVAMCTELLNVNRHLTSSRVDVSHSVLSLKDLVVESLRLIPTSVGSLDRHVSLSGLSVEKSVVGNKQFYMRVLLNIFKNALESCAAANREAKLEVSVRESPDHISLVISDNGGGIPEEVRSQLFRKGFTTKSKGSGLGLYSCRGIMRNAGGDLSIHSRGNGVGAQVVLMFPKFATEPSLAPAEEESLSTESTESSESPKLAPIGRAGAVSASCV